MNHNVSTFSLDQLDPMNAKGSRSTNKGTTKLKNSFSPLFEFFGLEPTGNIFKDVEFLALQLEDPRAFCKRIYEYIFDIYDDDGSECIDVNELGDLLRDIGEATGDEELKNLSKEKLFAILRDVDKDNNGVVDKEEFIDYMLPPETFESCEEKEDKKEKTLDEIK